jgi:hypothetical protein
MSTRGIKFWYRRSNPDGLEQFIVHKTKHTGCAAAHHVFQNTADDIGRAARIGPMGIKLVFKRHGGSKGTGIMPTLKLQHRENI